MKFDIIDALKQARKLLGYECTINCSESDGIYLIQIKVMLPLNMDRGLRPTVYGQQFTFTDHEVLMDEWYIMNEKFQDALSSLKQQIDG